jgi:hypothetical protein
MQRNLFCLLLVLISLFLGAQNPSLYYENRPAELNYFPMESCNTGKPDDLKKFLEKELTCSLILTNTASNDYTKTLSYSQYNNGVEVFRGYAKVILDNNSKSFMVFHDIFTNLPDITLTKPGSVWFKYHDNWVPAVRSLYNNSEKGIHDEIISDENNKELYRHDLALRGHPKDSTIRVKVFNPDPLTSAHKTYGVPYIDNNDSDIAVLNLERVWKNVICTFQDDTFWLKNKYLVPFKRLPSSYGAVYRKDTVFDYTRHQHEFEDVMILYHITTLQNYINSIGYSSMGFKPTPYDAHGDPGDQSTFLPGTGLIYGTGGIDDGEDAETITHEYTHSLRESVSPGALSGLERLAIEEAFCDYISTSYKMSIDSFGWKKWAYWDGNNPPLFIGRDVASPKIYPQALTGNVYENCDIFSSALMRIHLKLGKTITDRLALQTLYYLVNNLTMPQTAMLFIKADSVLYGGVHRDTIWRTFSETHILPWMTGISNPALANREIKMINSLNFMEGKGDLSIYLPETETGIYSISNNLGQIITKVNFNSDNLVIQNGLIKKPGIYYLNIQTSNYTVTKKLVVSH